LVLFVRLVLSIRWCLPERAFKERDVMRVRKKGSREMKRTKIAINILAAASLLLVMACEDPKTALSKFLDATISGDFVTIWDYASSNDKSSKDVQKFLVQSVYDRNPLVQAMSEKMSYKIMSVKADKTQAVAQVQTVSPDLAAIAKDVFGGDASNSWDKSVAQVKSMVNGAYSGKKLPMAVKTESYQMYKEQEGWKVYLNWKKDKQIEDLKAQARELERAKEYTAAQGKYQEVLVIDPNNQEAAAKIAELDQKLAGYGEAQAYIMKVIVLSSSVEPIYGGSMAVFAVIKNTGDRTLKMLEIVISFLDAQKNTVSEKSFRPVAVGMSASADENKPLKPGETRKFGVRADDLPAEWDKTVSIRISDLQFAQ